MGGVPEFPTQSALSLARGCGYNATGASFAVQNWMGNLLTFAKIVVGDTAKLALVWALLYLFQLLTRYLPVNGFAGQLIENIHQAGAVAVAGLLVLFLLNDVYQAHGAEGKQSAIPGSTK